MRVEDRVRFQHMLDAAQAALGFVRGRSRADLDADRLLLFGVLHALEILGEAANRLSQEARAQHPTLPWRAIVGMRNRLVHGYFDVEADIVWKTVTEELPPLVAQVVAVLEAPHGMEG